MPHFFSHTAPVTVARDRVWEALQEAETWSNIGPIEEVWDSEHGEDGTLTSYRWSARAAGRTWTGTATTAETMPNKRMRLHLVSPEIVGAVTVELHDHRITVSMEASPNGMLATMFWGAVTGALERGLPQQVERFAKSLE